MSGRLRLAVFASALWVGVCLYAAETDVHTHYRNEFGRKTAREYQATAIVPVALIWGVTWGGAGISPRDVGTFGPAADPSHATATAASHAEVTGRALTGGIALRETIAVCMGCRRLYLPEYSPATTPADFCSFKCEERSGPHQEACGTDE